MRLEVSIYCLLYLHRAKVFREGVGTEHHQRRTFHPVPFLPYLALALQTDDELLYILMIAWIDKRSLKDVRLV